MRPVLLAALTATLGCSTPVATSRRPVHGAFDRAAFDATWQRAVDALHAEGFEVSLADFDRGFVITLEREASAPCGEQRCLTRDVAMVKLERDGRASLLLTRQLWDGAAGAFRPVSDPAGLALVERSEEALLRAITGRPAEIRFSRPGEHCTADAECAAGLSCRERRCAR